MICLCKYARNSDIPSDIRSNDNLLTALFDVRVGEKYDIFGQAIFNKKLLYLIDPDDASKPNWYPAELFEMVDGTLPETWEFDCFPDQFGSDLGAIWGYRELVCDPDHFNELAERTPDALLIFANYKRLQKP